MLRTSVRCPRAGTVAPVLKEALEHAPALGRYLQRVAELHFDVAAPSFQDVDDASGWSSAGRGQEDGGAKVLTAEERKQRRRSWWWLGGAGLAVIAYAVFGGDYVQFAVAELEEEEEEGGSGDR
jgi:hypothetical protein